MNATLNSARSGRTRGPSDNTTGTHQRGAGSVRPVAMRVQSSHQQTAIQSSPNPFSSPDVPKSHAGGSAA